MNIETESTNAHNAEDKNCCSVTDIIKNKLTMLEVSDEKNDTHANLSTSLTSKGSDGLDVHEYRLSPNELQRLWIGFTQDEMFLQTVSCCSVTDIINNKLIMLEVSEKNDTHANLIASLTSKGLDGLDDYEDRLPSNELQRLRIGFKQDAMVLQTLLRHILKSKLIELNVLGAASKLQASLIECLINKGFSGLNDFRDEISQVKFEKVEEMINTQYVKELILRHAIIHAMEKYEIEDENYFYLRLADCVVRHGAIGKCCLERFKRHIAPTKYSQMIQELSGWMNLNRCEPDELTCEQTVKGNKSWICTMQSLDENRIAFGCNDNKIKIVDLSTGKCVNILKSHTNWVRCLQLLAKNILASASDDRTIRVWRLNGANINKQNECAEIDRIECDQTLKGHHDSVFTLHVLNNDILFSGSNDTTVKVWKWKTGKCIQTLKGHDDAIYSLQTIGQDRLASGSADGTIRIWLWLTGTCTITIDGNCGGFFSLKMLDDYTLASGTENGQIQIWNLEIGKENQLEVVKCCTIKGHSDRVCSLLSLPNNKLASGSTDKRIKIWDLCTEQCVQILKGHTNCVTSLQLLNDNRIASGSNDKTVKIWNLNAKSNLRAEKSRKLKGYLCW